MMDKEFNVRKRYCPNCNTLLFGYMGDDGIIKMECNCCGLVSVITIKNRRHSTVEEYLPRYMERLSELSGGY